MKWLLLGWLLAVLPAQAQQPVHFNITQQHGLPSNTVYNIFQDSTGFLWVATENGLARYNGAFFRRYSNPEVRSTAVSYLSEDEGGRIWLHNFFGEILVVENDTLKKLHSWEDKYSEGFPNITNLGDSLLISSTKELFYYLPAQKKWVAINAPESSLVNYNHHMVIDHTQWVCYASPTHTVVRSLNKSTEFVYTLDKTKYDISQNVVRLVQWQHALWLFDSNRKLLLELTAGDVRDLSAEYKNVLAHGRQVQNIGDSLLAFTGTDGAHIKNKKNEWQHLLPGKNVSYVSTDREGGIWVGTLNEGLYYFPTISSILYPKEKFGLYTKLAEDTKHRRVLAGSYVGQTDFFSAEGLIENTITIDQKKEVQALFVDARNNQVMVYNSSLRRYNLATLQLTDEQPIAAVKEIVQAGELLALATSAGLYLYTPGSKQKTILFSPQRITSLAFEEAKALLWVGTQKGVFQYHLTTQTINQWKDNKSFSPGASKLKILSNNRVAIGTLTNGLYLLKSGQQHRHFTTHTGLPSNRITALTHKDEALWIGTDNGIARLDLQNDKITILNKTKGLAATEVYDMLLTQNHLWVSHAEGLQIFSTLSPANSQLPVLHLQRASSDTTRLVDAVNGITLQPSSQQLTLAFDVSNNLRGQGNANIQYRIAEIDGDQWQTISLRTPIVNYVSLPYGTYTFEAFVTNEDGYSSAHVLHVPLIVVAPFWKQVWFTVLLFVGSASIIMWLVYRRLRKTSETNRLRLQQLNEQQALRIAQLTSIRAQMNPHFIFNTMSLIQGKVLNGLLEDANDTIQRFSMLLRNVLDFSGREMISLQEEIEVLEKYLAIEKDRFDGQLEFTIEVNKDASDEMIRIPSLLTQPFVENALRHGLMHKEGTKKLLINFSLSGALLTVTIDDNGIGRKVSAEFNKARRPDHTSFAIHAYEKRIELLNATRKHKIKLQIIDKYNAYDRSEGTTVLITIPLHDEHSE